MKILVALSMLFCSISASAQVENQIRDFKLAQRLLDEKKYEKALKALEPALKSDPENERYLLVKAVCLTDMGLNSSAYTIYTEMIERNPKCFMALLNRGVLLHSIREYEGALEDYSTGLKNASADSTRMEFLINRSSTYSSIRNFTAAYQDLLAAYKIDSNNLGVLNNLAAVSDEVGEGDKTIGYLERVVKLDSTFVGGFGNLGFKYQLMGEYEKSNAYFDKAIKLEPKNGISYNNVAYNYYKMGQLDKALKQVNTGIELYPSNSYAFRNRALIYLAMNKKELACTDLKKALVLGFTENYGPEVEELKSANCSNH